MAVLPKVVSALCAASQLPGEGPIDVEDAPTSAYKSKLDDDIFYVSEGTLYLIPCTCCVYPG